LLLHCAARRFELARIVLPFTHHAVAWSKNGQKVQQEGIEEGRARDA